MEQRAWPVGAAEQVTEQIWEIQDKYPGLGYMHVGCNRMGARPEVMLERFAEGVVPHFAVGSGMGVLM